MVYRTSGYAAEGQIHTSAEGEIEFCICARCAKLSRNSKEFVVLCTDAQAIGASFLASDERVVCGSCYALEQALANDNLWMFSDGVTPVQAGQLKKIIERLAYIVEKKEAEDIVTTYKNNPAVEVTRCNSSRHNMLLDEFLDGGFRSTYKVTMAQEDYEALSIVVRENLCICLGKIGAILRFTEDSPTIS